MKKNKYTTLFILLVLCFQGTTGFAQYMWQPVSGGLPYSSKVFFSEGNDIYMGYSYDISPSASSLNVAKWNGQFWTYFPEMIATSDGKYIGEIFLYNNEVYVYGSFDSIAGINGSHYLVKFSGKKWTDVGGGVGGLIPPYFQYKIYNDKLYIANIRIAGNLSVNKIACWDGTGWSKLGSGQDGLNGGGNINQMTVYQNQLIVAGSFSTAGGKTISNIASWDETDWYYLGVIGAQGVDKKVSSLQIVNGDLVVYGSFNYAGGIYANSVASWNGISWKSLNNTYKSPTIVSYLNNELYSYWWLSDSNYFLFKKWNGFDWIVHSVIFDYINSQSIVVFDNKKWAVGKFKFHNDSNYYDMIIYDGNTWEPFTGKVPGDISGSRYLLANDNYLYLSGSFDLFNGLKYNHIARLNSGFVGRIEGYVYIDSDIDCVKDSNETGISSVLVQIEPGDYYFCTNSDGKFEGYIDTGLKKITLVKDKGIYKYYEISPCNPESYELQVTDTSNSVENNFALIPVSNVVDLKVNLTSMNGWRARKGFNEIYQLDVKNAGTSPIISATASVAIDPKTNFLWSSHAYSNYNGNLYFWDFSDIQPGETRTIKFWLLINSDNAELGDRLSFYSDVIPVSADSDISDNYDTLFQTVTGSYDPNDKQCFPDGDITSGTDHIDYLIRFQNTGDDTAYRVVVVDTVETTNLPLTEIEIKTASHVYSMDVVDNVLIWTFNNIMLPHEKVNGPESHGFIRYSAHIKPGLSIGTKIENTAYIFFDYQKHVKTNKTLNTIVEKVGIDDEKINIAGLKVFPNPAMMDLFLEFNDNHICYQDLAMYNLLGKIVTEIRIYNGETGKINVSDFPAGLYFIKSTDGKFIQKVIISQ